MSVKTAIFQALFRAPSWCRFKRSKGTPFRHHSDLVSRVQKGCRLGVIPTPFQAFKMTPFKRHYRCSKGVVQTWLEALQWRHSSSISISACDAALGIVWWSERHCHRHLVTSVSFKDSSGAANDAAARNGHLGCIG